MIIISSILLRNTKIQAIALFPFIILRDKKDLSNTVLINHEKIHTRQQLEMLVIPFYIFYLLEGLIKGLSGDKNYYRNTSFEKEAYENENNLEYLKGRKWFSWFKYL